MEKEWKKKDKTKLESKFEGMEWNCNVNFWEKKLKEYEV